MITKKLIISGKVQGVSFRGWMAQRATQLNIWGWARNMADGTLEALLHGPEDSIEELVIDCNQGPNLAEVENIAIFDAENDGTIGFEIRADGP